MTAVGHIQRMLAGKSSLRSRGIVALGVPFVIYSALSLAFFASSSDWTRNYFGTGADPVVYVWFLHWWPFALTHALNPLVSDYLWHPGGIYVGWHDAIPSAALLAWPITLLTNPVMAFNLWSLLAPAFSAWTAFLLTRYLARDWAAALVGGYLFGFSSYELGHLMGHLSLSAVFLVPLTVLLCIRYARGEVKRRRFVVCLGLLLLLQLGMSIEILASLCVLGAITWVIFMIYAPAGHSPNLRRLAIDVILAASVMTVVASPFLFYQIEGLSYIPPEINSPTEYSADLFNYLVPTMVTRFGHTGFAPLASRFSGNAAEQGAYLGLPLVLLLAFYFRDQITNRYTAALLATLILLGALSLGPWLHAGGNKTGVPLPWLLALQLPLIRFALPTRFTMYVALIAAIAASLYLATYAVGRRRLQRFAFASLVCLSLVPNVRAYHWTPWPSESFFRPRSIVEQLGQMPNVLILPGGVSGRGLAWQLDAGMLFKLATAYVGVTPRREWSWSIPHELGSGSVFSHFVNDLTAFCATHQVNYILIGTGTPEHEIAAINALHWSQHTEAGIIIVKVPSPSLLRYHYVEGDYTPSADALNWMGHQVVVHTHGAPALLTLSGIGRPLTDSVDITLVSEFGNYEYQIRKVDTRQTLIPANATVTLTAGSTFVPDAVIHNGDRRSLSVRISIESAPTGSEKGDPTTKELRGDVEADQGGRSERH